MVPNVLGVLLFVLCARALASLDNSGSQLSQDTAISLDTVGFLADKSLQKSRRVRRQSDCTIRPERAGAPSTESESPVQSRPVQTSTKEQPPKALPTSTPPPSDGGGGGGVRPFGNFFAGNNTGGDVTFYEPGLGACGRVNNRYEYICAVPLGLFDSVPGYNGNPNHNPICGKFINVCYRGKCVRVQIVDRCADCWNPRSVDMSITAFTRLAPESAGRIKGITWTWA